MTGLMTRAAGIPALAALLATGCSGSAPSPPATPPAQAIPLLSTTDRAGNAERIAAFFRQQCVERIGSRAAFEEGLNASGWSARETQDSVHSPDHGRSGGYEFAGGFISAVWTQDGHANCLLTVETPRAAPFAALRDALSRFGGRPIPGAQPGMVSWRWNGGANQGFGMTLIASDAVDQRQISLSILILPEPWSAQALAKTTQTVPTSNNATESAR